MEQIILFTTLALFPFGQIIRIGIIHPLDLIVGIGALFVIIKKYKKPEIFKYFDNFLVVTFFSWLYSFLYYKDLNIFYGLLYLFRLWAYFYFSLLVFNFVKVKKNINLLTNSVIAISLFASIFGWIQYFLIPDIKPFFTFGWDEHLYRLVGTFLDPTFLGLILVFGALISFYQKKYYIFAFLSFSILFTYSRASYLALFFGLIYFAYLQKNIRKYLLVIPAFLIFALLLPTSKNHSISFFRTFSAIAKLSNYQNSVEIIKTSPVFGIGYNNLCFYKNKYVEIESYKSHACSGLDSSLLFVFATSGIVGLLVLIDLLIKMFKTGNTLFKSSLLALFVHSLFANSLFYPWILLYLLILFMLNLRE